MIRELDVGQSALLTDVATCINYYRLFTPGLYCCTHAPVQLDESTRLFPGVIAMVNHGRFKQCDPEPDYAVFRGPPNFVVDVFPGNDWLDYQERRDRFERAKVIEYVAIRDADPLTWIWNRLTEDKFTEIETPENETIVSAALPGLWFPSLAFKKRDWWAIMAAIARGVTRRAHHDFMDAIWNAGQ